MGSEIRIRVGVRVRVRVMVRVRVQPTLSTLVRNFSSVPLGTTISSSRTLKRPVLRPSSISSTSVLSGMPVGSVHWIPSSMYSDSSAWVWGIRVGLGLGLGFGSGWVD